ncbi:hypothetical protein BC939DRAFT_467118 [Gamsiella multidivaricata]|uniref:uncharacterized protein n=1 Tax=Gamsiella multidivaricata TaxID=101098 RepID=UPI00221F9215|nr:uncharacterized protein BC939DRAFT_467118 [Gamsiella multidivaricata]KAI7817068.1 hypothetical protein BC939DRAFT_467118 [Gamsiella multidivaricata]
MHYHSIALLSGVSVLSFPLKWLLPISHAAMAKHSTIHIVVGARYGRMSRSLAPLCCSPDPPIRSPAFPGDTLWLFGVY